MQNIGRITFAVCVLIVTLTMVTNIYWENVTQGISAYLYLNISGRGENWAGIVSNGMDVVCSPGACILHTHESLDTAVAQLNKLLRCAAATLAPERKSRGINHDSLVQCLQCTQEPGDICRVTHQDISSDRLLNKNSTVRIATERFKPDHYFNITRLEPSVFDLILSWKPSERAAWQDDWPFKDSKTYRVRNISHACTFNPTTLGSINITDIINKDGYIDSRHMETILDTLPDECKDNFHVLGQPRSAPDFSKHRVFVHIIREGTINGQGNVKVWHTEIIPNQCKARDAHIKGKTARYKSVFVISQFWGEGYFHANVEDLPRLMPYLEFLKQHPDIKIHAKMSSLRRNLKVLGLDPGRLVSGQVAADVIYLPQGGGCGHFHPIGGRLLYRHYARYIHKYMQGLTEGLMESLTQTSPQKLELVSGRSQLNTTRPTPEHRQGSDMKSFTNTPQLNMSLSSAISRSNHQNTSANQSSIILIHRTTRRWLAQHEEVRDLLQQIAHKKNLNFEVFSDRPSPDFNHTVAMFSRAKLVVAPHGAGLANLLFSPTETRVVEILCNPHPNMCYRDMHATLGQPYVGLLSVKPGTCGPIYVDLLYLKLLISSLLN